MGKIFGISDLPVSTIDKAIQSTQIAKKVSKTFVAMRNGIGKLMSHFSKKLVK